MADATLTVTDNRANITPFGSDLLKPLVDGAAASAGAAATSATLSGLYANSDTDTDIPGAALGERGAKYFADQAAAQLPLVNAAGTTQVAAVNSAGTTQVAAVNAAAAAIKYEREIDVIETTGIIPAIIDLATAIPSAESYGRLYAVRKAGTGTASVSIAKNGAPLYGPFTISGTAIDLNPAVSAAAGDNVQVVIESVTGSITAFYLKLERA